MAPLDTPLAKRLASYSVAAGVSLAVAPTSSAQVVYNDIDPDETISLNEAFELDVDGDGTADLVFAIGEGAQATTQARFILAGTNATQNGVLGQDAAYFSDPDIGSAFNLDSGAAIGPAAEFFPQGVLASIFNNTPYYPFIGTEGFVGFRFVAGGGTTHYGWARVSSASDSETGTIFEYAFESTPDTAIEAGAMPAPPPTATEPDALAAGYGFTPIAPNPITGRSTFEVTVARTEQVKVDVVDALGRTVRTLHDGAIAGGQDKQIAFVSDGLPTGVYVVRVVGESFDSTRTVSVVR